MVKSIANQDAIERYIRKVDNAQRSLNLQRQPESQPRHTCTSPLDHYSIAQTSRKVDSLTSWLGRYTNDPAFIVSLHHLSITLLTNLQDFLPRLKDHLLARAHGFAYDGDEHNFSDSDRRCVNIKDDRICHHSLLHVNYTTYDLRWEQDTINPLTRADIMVLSHKDERRHPYWYARVVDIFHVMVQHRADETSAFLPPERMNVLFVRWFRQDVNYPSGWSEKHLHRLQFFDQEHSLDAFGSLNPDCVVCDVHLIPAFGYFQTSDLLGVSRAHQKPDGEDPYADWKYHYLNM
jgi:hypothetical protein